jgi:hypothetical protein
MSAGWVAGTVRARMLASRRIGVGEARRVASCNSLATAVEVLDSTAYHLTAGNTSVRLANGPDGVAAAQRAIAAALLWELRVLAGWLPQGGAALIRALSGWFEIANVSELLRALDGREPAAYYELGALSTSWSAARRARSTADLRATLAASAWKDPGGAEAADIEIGLRARWAERVAALGEPARSWAASALALFFAGERFGVGHPDHPVLRSVAASTLGRAAARAETIDELADALPHRVSWVLARGTPVAELWRNEAIWWKRIESDAYRLLAGSDFDAGPVIGTVALLAADARRVWSALEVAGRGGQFLEVFDAVV